MNYNPPTKAELERARQSLRDKDKEALGDSYRQAHPNATDAEVKAFIKGREPDPPSESLDAAVKRLRPDFSDEQIKIFRGNR